MEKLNDSSHAEFEAFMADRFKDSIDRRRCKNGDGNDYMSWDMNVARVVWQHLLQRAEAAEAKLAELGKQKPIGRVDRGAATDSNEYPDARVVCLHEHVGWEAFKDGCELYTRPSPAADLADLLSRVVASGALTSPEHETIEAECCSILRKIEEAK